jgi:hypothetical protein
MSRPRQALVWWYLAVASFALVTCWRQNLAFMSAEDIALADGFVAFWPALLVNHATTSITVDIFLFGVAAATWMVLEARRTGMRFVWLYVVLGIFVAISVTFPIFLAARERRLFALAEPGPTATKGDIIGLSIFALPILAFAAWTLVS